MNGDLPAIIHLYIQPPFRPHSQARHFTIFSAPTMSTRKPNLWGLLSDTFQVIKSHFIHFLALAALFLFPLMILAIIYPLLVHPASTPPGFHRSLFIISASKPQDEIPPVGNPQILYTILFSLLQLFFSLCATASITYSTLRGFYAKPVSLISSLKAVLVSFLPLLATNLVLGLIFGLIGIAFAILAALAYNALTLMGFTINYDTDYFPVFVIFMAALLVLTSIYLQVEWFLSQTVVVAESKWGLEPLKRSSYLVKGMRRVLLSMFLLLATASILLTFGYYKVIMSISAGGISWCVVALLIVYAVIMIMLSLYRIAATTVFFAYCKAWHGEAAMEIDEELGMVYARLPGDEGKASYAVGVVCK